MATLYTDGVSALIRPEQRPTGDGDVRAVLRTYTMLGTEAENDVIRVVKLPAGTQILPLLSKVKAGGTVAATATMDVGDEDGSGDDDRYATNLNIAAAGIDAFNADPLYTLTEDTWITATFDTLSTITEGTVITFLILYRSA